MRLETGRRVPYPPLDIVFDFGPALRRMAILFNTGAANQPTRGPTRLRQGTIPRAARR